MPGARYARSLKTVGLPTPAGMADSKRDSNSSNQRLAAAVLPPAR
jgi:hypothetical protein